jgi:hypothetical protein
MKAEPLRSPAGQSVPSSINSEESTSKPNGTDEGKAVAEPSKAIETADAATNQTLSTTPPVQQAPENSSTSTAGPAQKSAGTSKPATVGKAPGLPKATVERIVSPPPPVEPQPTLPVSMIARPDSAALAGNASPFPGELEESFENALARVRRSPARDSFAARVLGRIRDLMVPGTGGSGQRFHVDRTVPFDGFRNDIFETKRERDRRYGTVYTVSEEVDAFLVRLELPRRMPKSSLKQTWELPDEMPDYACALDLTDNVLRIRAGLPDEARRRLSYISSSFPSDFQTRIEFPTPVEAYKHRMLDKMLEIIVYKKSGVSRARGLRRQQLQDRRLPGDA